MLARKLASVKRFKQFDGLRQSDVAGTASG